MTVVTEQGTQTRRAVLILQGIQIACLIWITWLPVSQGMILYPALAGVFGSSAALLVLQRPSVPRELRWMAAIYAAMVVVLALRAFVQGNPGAHHQTALWVGVPILWGTWALTLRGQHLRRTITALVVVTGVTSLTLIWLGCHALGAPRLFPHWFVSLQQIWFTRAESGPITLHYTGLSSLVGLAVLTLALAILPGRTDFLPPLWLIRVVAALAFVASVVTGRRVLALVVVLTLVLCVVVPAVLGLWRRGSSGPARGYWRAASVGAVGVLVVCLSPFGPNLTWLAGAPSGIVSWNDVLPKDSVLPSSTPSTNGGSKASVSRDAVRFSQVSELISQWRERPILGEGLGAVLDSGYGRSSTRPWMFENQPLQILMNIGLAGFAVLGVLCLFMGRLLRRAWAVDTHNRLIAASGIGLLMMLVADGTNPYLAAPGHGWAVFLCIGVCAAALTPGARDASRQRQ